MHEGYAGVSENDIYHGKPPKMAFSLGLCDPLPLIMHVYACNIYEHDNDNK